MKIGMYSDEEILEHLTEGEGRGFLGRSMYDAIIEKINKKEAMYDSLAVDYRLAQEEIERLNNNLKNMTKLFAKEKEQTNRLNNIIKEVREDIEDTIERYKYYGTNDLDLSVLSFWVEKLQILDKGE